MGGGVGFCILPRRVPLTPLPSWHPAAAGEVCRKADTSLDKLQVSEGWVLQGWPRPRATHVPPPRHASPSTAARRETWGASPNWGGQGGSPSVSPFLRTYQKQRAFASILSGRLGFWVLGEPRAVLRVCRSGRR